MAKREHLHRGKRFGSGEWVYGNAVDIHDTDGGVCIVTDIKWATEEFIDCIYNSKVIPESVGEFTGLTDKNGVKIFEGDIVKTKTCVKTKAWHVVIIENGEVYLKTFNKVKTTPLAENMNFQSIMRDIEVIGNIFDNPELMRGDKNG